MNGSPCSRASPHHSPHSAVTEASPPKTKGFQFTLDIFSSRVPSHSEKPHGEAAGWTILQCAANTSSSSCVSIPAGVWAAQLRVPLLLLPALGRGHAHRSLHRPTVLTVPAHLPVAKRPSQAADRTGGTRWWNPRHGCILWLQPPSQKQFNYNVRQMPQTQRSKSHILELCLGRYNRIPRMTWEQ